MQLIYLSVFGLLGIFIRYIADTKFSYSKFPVHTLAVNLIGCFLIGVFYSLKGLNPDFKLALTVGLCGGLTTFSSYSIQTLNLIQQGEIIPAMSYLVISPILGLSMVYVAMRLFN